FLIFCCYKSPQQLKNRCSQNAFCCSQKIKLSCRLGWWVGFGFKFFLCGRLFYFFCVSWSGACLSVGVVLPLPLTVCGFAKERKGSTNFQFSTTVAKAIFYLLN